MKTPSLLPFDFIGSGFCGSVWAPAEEENSYALKREDGGQGRSLANDYDMHKRILTSLEQFNRTGIKQSFPRVLVPRCMQYIDAANSEWWSENILRFPQGYSPCNVLQSERIPPLPRLIRERLIDKYCPMALRAEIKASSANQSCLVRPYIGKRGHAPEIMRRHEVFSLENFPLHRNQMEELKLDVISYAKTMADALAMMHWHCKIDASDVEFVLAPPRDLAQMPFHGSKSSFLGEHTMWMLDFDYCRSMSMDSRGVTQAVTAFFQNDPFYPSPGPNGTWEQELWLIFRLRYLQTSFFILIENPERLSLPLTFVEKIEGTALQRSGTRWFNVV